MKTFSDPELKVGFLGHSVSRFLQRKGNVAIIGVTSKGIFLKNDAGQICFLSREPFRGPLTINLESSANLDSFFHIGDNCQIDGNRIIFSHCQVVIQNDAIIWEPPSINIPKVDFTLVMNRGIDFITRLDNAYQTGIFTDFFKCWSGQSWGSAFKTLRNIIPGDQNDASFYQVLQNLLGLGSGLTPSGDDFICGFLLDHYWLGKILPAVKMQSDYIEEIIASAQKKTTALSAALIACAAEGQADERLMNLLNWLLTCAGDVGRIKEELLSYGNSSGMDTFAGMLAAILLSTDAI